MKTLTKTRSPASGIKLKTSQFQMIREVIYNYCGINMHEGKEALVQNRLLKRLRKLGLGSFDEYFSFIENDKSGAEFLSLVDVLTTNKTSFFRERKHFDFIERNILPGMAGRSVKWWSAGCSTGQEPITCAITLLEAQQRIPWTSVKILATDISREVLHTAKQGVYTSHKIGDMPAPIVNKYFNQWGADEYQVVEEVQKMITYGRLNLTKPWPLKGKFQLIMCRNVMIYFNRETQKEIVAKFYDLLEPGGYLFLGHSESIPSDNKLFKNIAPASYQKQ
ncbi:MAG: chemotaxis protein CheR [Balneolaceae bacterium]|nr:chemotaxis protein CheR [Balneolaceae bacterium]